VTAIVREGLLSLFLHFCIGLFYY